jgi:hypothetical protein
MANLNHRSRHDNGQPLRHSSLNNVSRVAGLDGSHSYPQIPSSDLAEASRVRFDPDTFHEDEDNPLDWLADLFFGALAFQCSLGVMTIVITLYLIVRPFSVAVYRRLANQIGVGSYLEAISLLLPNTKIYLTGDSDVPSPLGTSILVSNHVADADWYSLLMLGRCVGLRGSIKVFLRNEILHLNKQMNTEKRPLPMPRRRSSPPSPTRNVPSSGPVVLDTIARNGPAIPQNGNGNFTRSQTSPDLTLVAKFLNYFIEFPLIDEEDYVSDRESLFQLLRSFADRSGATAPSHFLLFPEGWSLYNGQNRKSVLARSNEFAKREGRPQLKHLLLPRTTGFNASISSLRESSPVIYDVTIAFRGYDGSVPPRCDLSLFSMWGLLRRRYPDEIYVRMKRYSMEEVLQDASWLDKKWAEKDRLLDHFSRHTSFPVDSRGFARRQLFETRFQSAETSVVSLIRLLLVPCAVPVLLLLSIPIVWTTFVAWLLYKGYQYAVNDESNDRASQNTSTSGVETGQTPGSASQAWTPFFPATPFASPLVSNWRDLLLNRRQ